MLVGTVLAYIGSVTRWLFTGRKKTINYFFRGAEEHDLSKHFTNSIFHKLLGMVVLILLIFVIGYFTKI